MKEGVRGLQDVKGVFKVVIRVLPAVNLAEMADEGRHLRYMTQPISITVFDIREVYALREIPTTSSMPSIRKRASNSSMVQDRTSSSGSLCGSKPQLPRESISLERVLVGRSAGVLQK